MPIVKNDSLYYQVTSPHYTGNHAKTARPAGGGSQGLTTVINRFEHTVNFAANVDHGQFIGGDYWVMDAGNGVQAVSKSPAQSTDANGYVIHGVMKNPSVGGNQGLHQSQFDGDGIPTTNTASFWDAAENLSFPITLVAGDRLVLGKSRVSGQTTNWTGGLCGKDPVMESYVVITVVGSEPSATAFRPCPADPLQTIYDANDIDWSKIPSLSTVGVTLPTETGYDDEAGRDVNFGYWERGSERGVPVWFNGWQARPHHPRMHSEDYHEDIGKFFSNCFGMISLDVPQARKQQLVYNLVQQSIDYYGVAKQNAGGDSSWWTLLVIFAGIVFNDADMRDCYLNATVTKEPREMEKIYYDEDREDTLRTYAAGTTPGIGWSGYKVFFRKVKVDTDEFESRSLANWSAADRTDESYRRYQDVEPIIGMHLVAQAMGVRDKMAHDAGFEMCVRWVVDTDTAAEDAALDAAGISRQYWGPYTNSAGSTFLTSLWNVHASTWTWPDQGGTVERTLT